MVCVNSVNVTPSNVTLKVGEWYYGANAEVLPSNATCSNIEWYSENTGIASVNASNGYIYANGIGTTKIYARATDGSEKSDYITVTVISNVEVEITPSSLTLGVGRSAYLEATVSPVGTNQSVRWSSSNTSIATVNPYSGLVLAQSVGDAIIYAMAEDGSGVTASCPVSVKPRVQSVTVSPSSATMLVGEEKTLTAIAYPSDAINTKIKWRSSNEAVATVDLNSGVVTAISPGTVSIEGISVDTGWQGTCEITVHRYTPVFLIHGRTSNSFGVWGAGNSIFVDPLNPDDKDNNHFNPSLNALSSGNTQALYTSKSTQDILSYNLGRSIEVDGVTHNDFTVHGVFNGEFKDGKYTSQHPEGGNLAYYLKNQGYRENINLFVFNYPNEDAVVHSAKKFEKYIENLINYVRTSGPNEMKAAFYASETDYNANNYKINLVGHSMGGLVSRYYIENLGHDNVVDKLITICTPHWGSGYADTSCIVGGPIHKICDHDLRFDSAMYGGDFTTALNCNTIDICYNGSYSLTDELKYSLPRSTKYYAIAAIDYKPENINSNDYTFEIPNNLDTYQSLIDYMTNKSVYKTNILSNIVPIDLHEVGDNMVGLLSQIGWTENDTTSPNKKILMEKIFIDVDANGENGNNIPGLEMLNMLHNKTPHRTCIAEQVNKYLNE